MDFDLAARFVDRHFGRRRCAAAERVGKGDTDREALTRLTPIRHVGNRLDHGCRARVVLQHCYPIGDRIHALERGDLVDQGFDSEFGVARRNAAPGADVDAARRPHPFDPMLARTMPPDQFAQLKQDRVSGGGGKMSYAVPNPSCSRPTSTNTGSCGCPTCR